MDEKMYCGHCNKMTYGKNISREELFNVKGEKVKINASIMICNECNKEVFVEAVEERNLEKAYMEYRKLYKLITPEQDNYICAYCGEDKRINPWKHIAEIAEFLREQVRECQEILKTKHKDN